MLASITPLGERGRHGHWPITVSAFLLGAVTAAALLGALLGLAGSVMVAGLSDHARLAILGAALLAAAAVDAGLSRVPGPRRQVDERWLDQYRGWVYGLGYGAQMGAAVATVVTSAATYAALLAAFLTADPSGGALVLGGYGLMRGLTPMATARVRTPGQLLRFHARLQQARAGVARVGTALLVLALVLSLAAAVY
jgi:hypothetical protein